MSGERPPIRVRTYSGASQQVSGQQFEADAADAARNGYMPVAQAWEGPVLTVTYQLQQVSGQRHPGIGAGAAVIVGGGMIALAPFLPWATYPLVGDIGGMQFGDGVWVLALGALTLLGGLLITVGPTHGRRGLGIVFALLSLSLTAFDFANIRSVLGGVGTIGPGLWAAALGGAIALVGAIVAPTE